MQEEIHFFMYFLTHINKIYKRLHFYEISVRKVEPNSIMMDRYWIEKLLIIKLLFYFLSDYFSKQILILFPKYFFFKYTENN